MRTITLQEWCDFELFMISHNYTGAQIKAERAKCIITNSNGMLREPVTLKGDMAQEFNDSQEDPDCLDEQDPMGL